MMKEPAQKKFAPIKLSSQNNRVAFQQTQMLDETGYAFSPMDNNSVERNPDHNQT